MFLFNQKPISSYKMAIIDCKNFLYKIIVLIVLSFTSVFVIILGEVEISIMLMRRILAQELKKMCSKFHHILLEYCVSVKITND